MVRSSKSEVLRIHHLTFSPKQFEAQKSEVLSIIQTVRSLQSEVLPSNQKP